MEHQDILKLITQNVDCQSIVNLLRSNSKLYNINTITNLLKNNLYNRTGLILKDATLEQLIILCQGIEKIKIEGFGNFLVVKNIAGSIYKFDEQYQAQRIDIAEEVIQIDPGFDQILFLTKSGQVYYLDAPGEITHRTVLHKEYSNMPHLFRNIKHAEFITGRNGYVYFLNKGLLYEYTIDYQNLKRNNNPTLLSKLNTFSKIFIDPEYDAIYLLDINNQVYFMGEDGYDVWEFEDERIDTPIPLNINNIVDIALGREHGLFLTVEGEVYSFGSNYFGQLGLGKVKHSKLILLPNFPNIKQIVAGDLSSYFLDNEGHVYKTGDKINYFTKIDLEDIVQIATSALGTMCLNKYGEIFIINGETKLLDFNVYDVV